ncbi:MAG TPA: hypothetical protein VD969_29715 [Symbiobacteriaceae bacterium]|nr:hypothetical protein [Symbiobacteriaceae bacterium]
MTNNKGDKVTQAFQWDTEDRAELLSQKEGHLRETFMYLTSPLWSDMQEAFGGVITNLKTSTDVATGEVSVGKALPDEPGAVPVRLLGALNSAEFSFFRPLRKLNIKVPADRQFNVTPFTREVEGVGTVFVFPLAERRSVPRNRREEEAAAAAEKAAAAGQSETKTE